MPTIWESFKRQVLQRRLCRLVGHEYEEMPQIFLPCRCCKHCGNEQVKVPNIGSNKGGWKDREVLHNVR